MPRIYWLEHGCGGREGWHVGACWWWWWWGGVRMGKKDVSSHQICSAGRPIDWYEAIPAWRILCGSILARKSKIRSDSRSRQCRPAHGGRETK